jgi:DNA-binding LacI/PurR family transcriptional regulator
MSGKPARPRRVRDERERFLKSKEAVVRERLRGYVDAAADIGLDFRSLRIYEAGELGLTAGQAAAFNLLTSVKLTAVVATSDVMALACLKAAEDLDIEVPGELSIVGFDDIPEAIQAGEGANPRWAFDPPGSS